MAHDDLIDVADSYDMPGPYQPRMYDADDAAILRCFEHTRQMRDILRDWGNGHD